jgi:hypothetical protein
MSTTTQEHLFEELDYREADGIEVSLLWNRAHDGLTVYVNDTKTGDAFELAVLPGEAREAFTHPFVYRGRR